MSTILRELEALYRETGNPLYVWKAFAEECRPGEPLPGWIEEYLRECAGRLLDPAEQVSPSEAARRTAAALGLTSNGRNAFAELKAIQRNAAMASLYEIRAKPGRREAYLAEVSKKVKKNRATVLRRIARARKLWDAQK
jgi:hypothetical protein